MCACHYVGKYVYSCSGVYTVVQGNLPEPQKDHQRAEVNAILLQSLYSSESFSSPPTLTEQVGGALVLDLDKHI